MYPIFGKTNSLAYNLESFKYNDQTHFQNHPVYKMYPIHSVHILIPNIKVIPETFDNLMLEENDYFLIKNILLSNLIEEEFTTNFLNKGQMWAFTHNADANIDDFISIIPQGKIIISLKNNLHKILHYKFPKNRTSQNEKLLIIETNSSNFSKVKANISRELSKLDFITFDLLLKWKPEENICPSSICTYFQSKKIECIVYEPNRKHSVKYSVPSPEISFRNMDNVFSKSLRWIETHISGIDYEEPNDFCYFTISDSNHVLGQLCIGTWKGFYTDSNISLMMHEIRDLFAKNPCIPYVILALQGYKNSYVVQKNVDVQSTLKFASIIVFANLTSYVIVLNDV